MKLHDEILKALLYYDIWSYPLSAKELFNFLPVNSMTLEQFKKRLNHEAIGNNILEHEGFYFVMGKTPAIVADRQRRQIHARRMWRMARLSMHIIKRFPFVRGVFISGDLSKNATSRSSDVDFFILTEPDRLWITRTLLTLFKKVFLFNSKKFFCLNYFSTTENLTVEEKNIFVATEIATLKPLFNSKMFFSYLAANNWITRFFPNFDISMVPLPKVSERPSKLQKLFEAPFSLFDATRLDELLMQKMIDVWARRYPIFDEETRKRIFKCTRNESHAYVGDFEKKILAIYQQRLKDFGVHS